MTIPQRHERHSTVANRLKYAGGHLTKVIAMPEARKSRIVLVLAKSSVL